ncbi:hypothetical protein C7C46_03525 [Streptomyces tateyamensis]|uniref:Uncharacterized protein n=1 Tax=Streptomyces tateyamensis TaxID=565073 RepID=A0A2V4PMZ2_9ACTN|nr:DUF6296 family protein [Streptomyces tateyamensis]PYC87606.1 hypothetical protein C7C46_03525 [Streptomyces tateyamensis]
MVQQPARYAITLPGPTGAHGPPEVVLVHATGETTEEGLPVYAEEGGRLRVEIRGGVAQPVDVDPEERRHTSWVATPMP